MSKYIPTIGLEIHAELKTKSKMFCSCKNDPFNAKQNENICPVCLGMPGTLPAINKEAVYYTIDAGLYLNGEISKFTKWDRKNYFYPDLPKGYQISQYDLPIVRGGYIEITQISNLKTKKIRITRIHLEEDTGTSKHPEEREGVNYSLIDYNRAGVPLMELVTEPDISSGKEAKEFCQKYQLALRHLGIADADMEKGQFRCEVNISLCKSQNSNLKSQNHNLNLKTDGQKLGTKVEIKNLNSFKAVEKAIEYEIERQSAILEEGGKIIQETRGWDDIRGKTYTMRVKETSADYRYFPEPDLPPVTINQTEIDKRKKNLPFSLERIEKEMIEKYGISPQDVKTILYDIEKYSKFSAIERNSKFIYKYAKRIANILINEPLAAMIRDDYLMELSKMLEENEISSKIFKEILPDIKKGKSPSVIIKEKGLKQISNSGELEKIVEKIIKENPEVIAKIKAGKVQVMGFLVGQVMKETKGQANPQLVNEIIRKKIK